MQPYLKALKGSPLIIATRQVLRRWQRTLFETPFNKGHTSIRHQHGDDSVAMPPVDAKIGVERENFAGRVDFRESNQAASARDMGLWRLPAHERPQVRLLLLHGKGDTNHSPLQQCKKSIGFATLSFEQEGRFCKDRFAR